MSYAINTPTTDWHPVLYGSTESANDQKGGQSYLDIVGDATSPSFYIRYNEHGGLAPASLAFRVRLNGVKNESKPTYDRVVQVGIDADQDGALDLFVGTDQSGNNSYNAIWQAAAGLNTSPDTIAVEANPSITYNLLTDINYHFAAVTGLLDPNAQTFDVDGGGANDYFLSFSISFADLLEQLSRRNIAADSSTHFTYVVSTALKSGDARDILGVDSSVNSTLTWNALEAASVPITPMGAMPEPGTCSLIVMGGICGMIIRRYTAKC